MSSIRLKGLGLNSFRSPNQPKSVYCEKLITEYTLLFLEENPTACREGLVSRSRDTEVLRCSQLRLRCVATGSWEQKGRRLQSRKSLAALSGAKQWSSFLRHKPSSRLMAMRAKGNAWGTPGSSEFGNRRHGIYHRVVILAAKPCSYPPT